MVPTDDPLEEPPAYRLLPSPQSLLPPRPEYRRGGSERFGDDAVIAPAAIYAFLALTPVCIGLGFLLATEILHLDRWTVPFALVFGLAGGLVVMFGSMGVARRLGKGVGSMVMPSGSATPYQRGFSALEALAAQGHVGEALRGYEREVAASPQDVEALVKAADLYILHKTAPERAAELLRAVRRVPSVRPEKVLYASHRLVDLYLGPLNDRGKALVELRSIMDRFPGSQAAIFARDGLARLKREYHEDANPPV